MKTKWWKRAHAVFARGLAQAIKMNLKLPNTPDHPAYTRKWPTFIKSEVRKAAVKWRESPAWREETKANNEAEIDRQLTERGFHEAYLWS